MTTENKSNALAQYGPVGAPVLGIVLAIVLIVAALMTSGVSDKKEQLQGKISDLTRKMSSQDANEVPPEVPLTDSVKASLEPDNSYSAETPKGLAKTLNLPITFDVEMQAGPVKEFEQYDLDNSGFWTEDEFQQTPYYPDVDFNEWDRDDDGQISRAEYSDPPVDDEKKFREQLDKNEDGVLVPGEDDITKGDADRWDRFPYDGKIDLDEYKRRHEEHLERDYGAVENVEAALDPEKMEIVVKWDEPSLAAAPEDITYIIERRAPETVEQRRSDYRKEVGKHQERVREWEKNHFDPWFNGLSDDYKKRHGIQFSKVKAKAHFADLGSSFDKWWASAGVSYRRSLGIEVPPEGASPEEVKSINDAAKQMAESEIFPNIQFKEPVPPPEPSEWEVVAVGVSGNEYRDSTFEMDVTYTYAVRMESDKDPTRDHVKSVADDPADFGTTKNYVYKDRTATKGHPVRIQNRISMGYDSSAGQEQVTLRLETWYKIVAADDSHTWYRVRVRVTVTSEQDVGDEYGRREIDDLDGVMVDPNGTEAAATELLPDDARVNFDTGFRFIVKQGSDVLLTHDEYGDYELPGATAQEPSAIGSPAGKENPIELRALSIKADARGGVFELTRWHQLENGDWVRVVTEQTVNKGDEIGMKVDLNSPGRGVRVYDSSGGEIGSVSGGGTVDLSVGEFEGLNDRTLEIGGEEIDLFSTLYKE